MSTWTLSELYAAFGIVPAGVSPISSGPPAPEHDFEDPLLAAQDRLGWLRGPPNTEGWYPCRCPQEHLHTMEGGLSATAYRPGLPRGQFVCLHGHCVGLQVSDLVAAVEAASPGVNLSTDSVVARIGEKLASGLGLDQKAVAELELPPAIDTEEELARRFAERWRGRLRYVAVWDRWLVWDGVRWRLDDTRLVLDHVRALCVEAAAANPKAARKIASAASIAAVERIARGRRWIAAAVEDWDQDPWLLNTPAGTWNLQTGVLQPHDSGDMITQVTGVSAADGDNECPRWLAFLERVTGGDIELQAYLRRMAGYMLTGSVREHAIFFAYGSGANGKSVFLNALAWILGDYHKTAAIETFMASRNERHPEEIATLRGARLVTAVENEAGRHWAESKIKQLTGGDKVRARFMRQDSFEFSPTFKLLPAGNHKPLLHSVDEAIRRRLNLIPFTVTIPANERDLELGAKLQKEGPGILAWAIEGCLEWQENGLMPPRTVRAASDAYFGEQDTLARWLEECCEQGEGARTPRTDLWTSWSAWAARSGEPARTPVAFYEGLEKHGFSQAKVSVRYFNGLKLVDPAAIAAARMLHVVRGGKDDDTQGQP